MAAYFIYVIGVKKVDVFEIGIIFLYDEVVIVCEIKRCLFVAIQIIP